MGMNLIRRHKTSHGFDEEMNPARDRESYVLIADRGAVEGWRSKAHSGLGFSGTDFVGGIELHSKTPLYEDHSAHEYCEWTGGACYHDGSSIAYDRIADLFESPRWIFAELESWLTRLGYAPSEIEPHD